jgi:cupin 2 domain-containing protein
MTTIQNLFIPHPDCRTAEQFEMLVENRHVRIERIVSHGQASPEGFWYDQPWSEWVMVLTGKARLRFENQSPIDLKPGDAILIPAHARHRVDWTTDVEQTIWLAVHFDADQLPVSSVNRSPASPTP